MIAPPDRLIGRPNRDGNAHRAARRRAAHWNTLGARDRGDVIADHWVRFRFVSFVGSRNRGCIGGSMGRTLTCSSLWHAFSRGIAALRSRRRLSTQHVERAVLKAGTSRAGTRFCNLIRAGRRPRRAIRVKTGPKAMFELSPVYPKRTIGRRGLQVSAGPTAESREPRHPARCFSARTAWTPHGEATEVKLGGFSGTTQDVSGAAGSARNDTITA